MTSLERYSEFTRQLNDDDEKDPPTMAAVRLPVNPPTLPGNTQIDRERQAKEAMGILKVRGVIE